MTFTGALISVLVLAGAAFGFGLWLTRKQH